MKEQVQCINFPNTTNKMHDNPQHFLDREVHLLMLLLLYPVEGKQFEVQRQKQTLYSCICLLLLLTSPIYNTCLLAFVFCLEAVVIPTTASVPELRTGIGLFVIVPVDFVLAAGTLFQCEDTAGINRLSLCEGKGKVFGEYLYYAWRYFVSN